MADGRVIISVDVDGKDVKVLNGDLDQLDGKSKRAGSSIKGMALAMGAVKIASAAFKAVADVVKNMSGEVIKASDAIDKFKSTMNFAGKTEAETEKATKAMKKYADETVYDLETVANTTAQLAANGVKDYTGLTEAAGNLNAVAGGNADTFKSVAMMLTQTAGAGKLTTENWNQLADAIPGASGKLQEALEKAGAYTGNFRDAMAEGQISAEEFSTAIMDLGMTDVAKEAATSTKTFEGAFGNLEANIVTGMQNILDAIGKEKIIGVVNRFSEVVTIAFDKIVEAIPIVVSKFEEFFGFVKENIGAFQILGGILTVVGSALLAMKGYFSAMSIISTVSKLLGILNTAFTVLSTVGLKTTISMLMGFMGPVGWIVTAIGALIGVFVYLWQTNETFRDKVTEIWNAIVAFLQPIIETITTFITEKWTALAEWWSENQQGFFDKISEIWNAIVETVQPIIQAISDFIMQVWGTVVDWWNENQQLILDTTLAAWEAIKEVFSGVMTAISSIVEVAMELIYIVVSTILGNIKAFWDQWGSTIKTIVKAIWTVISNIFQGTLKNILTIVTSIITQIKTIIQSVMTIIKGIINVALGIIKGDWNRVLSGIKQIVSGFKSYVTSTFSNLMSTAKSLVSNGIQAVKNTFNSLRNIDLFSVGRNIIQGLVNGISSMVGAVASEISKVAGNIKSKIKGALGIHSPSRWMRDMIGKNMMLGWEIGIDKNAKIPAKAMEDATDLVIPKVSAERVLLANGSAYRGTNSQTINNNSSSVKTIENKPLVTMNVIWQGKEDIKRTMETMGWIVNVDKKGALE